MTDNLGGRPQEYDRMQIGRDFVKWATNNPEALTVPMFAVSIGLHSGMMRNWAKDDIGFRSLFMEGKEQIGINRLKSTLATTGTKLDSSIYRAHVGNYDTDINLYMREEKEFEADLKKAETDYINSKAPSAIDLENLRMENEALRAKLAKLEKGE